MQRTVSLKQSGIVTHLQFLHSGGLGGRIASSSPTWPNIVSKSNKKEDSLVWGNLTCCQAGIGRDSQNAHRQAVEIVVVTSSLADDLLLWSDHDAQQGSSVIEPPCRSQVRNCGALCCSHCSPALACVHVMLRMEHMLGNCFSTGFVHSRLVVWDSTKPFPFSYMIFGEWGGGRSWNRSLDRLCFFFSKTILIDTHASSTALLQSSSNSETRSSRTILRKTVEFSQNIFCTLHA